MIRVYDRLGRITEEIDLTQDNAWLHVSYVIDAPPFTVVAEGVAFELPEDVRRSRQGQRAAATRARRKAANGTAIAK